jgi:lipopolysaccharide transport protein LptA
MDPELGPLSIDADRVESHNDTGKFVFTGNVDLVCKKFRLRAKKVVANRSAGGTGMEKVDAEGSVTLRMNNENGQSFTCSGNRAIYDPIKETIKLSGWPRIDEGARALVANSAATEFLIDTKTGKLSSEGATKTILK